MNKPGFLIAFTVFTLSIVTLSILWVEGPTEQSAPQAEAGETRKEKPITATRIVRDLRRASRLTTESGRKAAERRLLNPNRIARGIDKENRKVAKKEVAAGDPAAGTPAGAAPAAPNAGGSGPAPTGAAAAPTSGEDPATGEKDAKDPILMSDLRWTPANNAPPFALSLGTFMNQRAARSQQGTLSSEKLDAQWLAVKVENMNQLVDSWLLYTGDCKDLDCVQQLQTHLQRLGLNTQIITLPPPPS